jgi:hypothetical protein
MLVRVHDRETASDTTVTYRLAATGYVCNGVILSMIPRLLWEVVDMKFVHTGLSSVDKSGPL